MDNNEIIVEAYIKKSANIFKNIIELLAQITPIKKCDISNTSIKQIFFKITSKSIRLANEDSDILIDINLDVSKFCSYKYNYEYSDLNIGINSNIIKTFFKNSKKSEGVLLRIRKDKEQICPSEVELSICSEDNNDCRGSTIKFTITQNIHIRSIETAVELITIPNHKFLSICKEMGTAKKLTKITVRNNTMVFSNNEADVATNWISFQTVNNIELTNYTKSEYIKSISKLASFDDSLKIFKVDGYIVFKSFISKCTTKLKVSADSIGFVNVYIKLEPENEGTDSEDELLEKIYNK